MERFSFAGCWVYCMLFDCLTVWLKSAPTSGYVATNRLNILLHASCMSNSHHYRLQIKHGMVTTLQLLPHFHLRPSHFPSSNARLLSVLSRNVLVWGMARETSCSKTCRACSVMLAKAVMGACTLFWKESKIPLSACFSCQGNNLSSTSAVGSR